MAYYDTDAGRFVEAQTIWRKSEALIATGAREALDRAKCQTIAAIQCALQEAYESGKILGKSEGQAAAYFEARARERG